MSETKPSPAAAKALRDAVMNWEQIRDELVLEFYWPTAGKEVPDETPIPQSRVEEFCRRFPHFDEQIREHVHYWNSTPRLSDEMIEEIAPEMTREEIEDSRRRTMWIIDFHIKLRTLQYDYDAKCEELAANKAVAVALQRELAAVKAENEKFETFIKNLYVKSPTIAECLRTLGVIDEEGNSIPEQKP